MLRSSISIGLLILCGTILAEDIVPPDELNDDISHATDETSRTGRFGFSVLNDLRRSFCRTFCTSADTMPYLMNLLCAAKCPELYLPHGTTTESIPSMSTSAATTTSPITEGTTTVSTTTQGPTTMSTTTQGPTTMSTTTQGITTTTTTTTTATQSPTTTMSVTMPTSPTTSPSGN